MTSRAKCGMQLACFELVLNAAARLVVKKRKWESITKPFVTSSLASGVSACRLQDLSTGVQVSSPIRRSVPHVDPVLTVSTRRHLRSACQGDLIAPRTRRAGFGPRSFSVAGLSTWNSLPPEIKTTSLTLGQFCGRLKTEMFLSSHYSSAQPS